MERQGKPRARCCNLISFAILTAAIYVTLVTLLMMTLYRVVVMQTARIQTLETVASELAERVYRLEKSFKAQGFDEKTVSKTDRALQENAMIREIRIILALSLETFKTTQLLH